MRQSEYFLQQLKSEIITGKETRSALKAEKYGRGCPCYLRNNNSVAQNLQRLNVTPENVTLKQKLGQSIIC